MEIVNIHDAKTHLTALLNRVAAGETVLLGRRNKPVARLMPLAPDTPALKMRRPIGLAQGTFKLTPAFFEPLSDDLHDRWEGKSHETDTTVKAKAKAGR